MYRFLALKRNHLVVLILLCLGLSACGDNVTVAPANQGQATTATSSTTIATTTAPATITSPPATTVANLPTITAALATTSAATATSPATTAAATTQPADTTAAVTNQPAIPPTPRPANSKTYLAYVKAGSLHIVDLASGQDRGLIKDDDLLVVGQPDWSPDGRQLLVPIQTRGSQTSQLYLVNASQDSAKKFLASDGAGSDNDPAWSPDGKLVLFTRTTGGKHELWLADRDGQNPRKLADGQQGAWNPDSQRIAFVTNGSQTSDTQLADNNALHLINAKGQNEWEPMSAAKMPKDLSNLGYPFGPDTRSIQYPVWLDGGKLLGFSTIGHSGLIVTLNPASPKDMKFWDTQYEGGFGKLSATAGSWLAYETFPPSGFVGINLVNVSGQPDLQKRPDLHLDNPQQNRLAYHPAFSLDGQHLAYLKLGKDAASGDLKNVSGSLTLVTFQNGKLGPEKELTTGQIQFLAWSK